MRRDHRHAAFERKTEQPRIGQRRIDHRARCVRRRCAREAAVPPPPFAPKTGDNACRKNRCSGNSADISSGPRRPRGSAPAHRAHRAGRDESRRPGEIRETCLARSSTTSFGTNIEPRSSRGVPSGSCTRSCASRTTASIDDSRTSFPRMLGVNRFEIAFERAGRNAELAQHETGEPSMPARQTQPAARAGDAVAHHVDMHVDALRAEFAWNRPSCSSTQMLQPGLLRMGNSLRSRFHAATVSRFNLAS